MTSTLGGPARVDGSEADARTARRLPAWPAVALAYLLGSLVLHHRVLPDLAGTATGALASDSGLFSWWLEWTWWSVWHGQNPLFTTWMNAPGGVNGLWNTTVPLLGAVLGPVTALAGPVVTFNVGMILGPVATALVGYGALRPWVARALPRAVGGALIGFGPFMAAHLWAGHLNLVWVVLPPFLLWAVHALFVAPRRPWVTGAVIGLVFAAQTGLYTLMVALGAIVLVVVAVVLAALWPREVRRRLPDLARAGAACVGVYVVLCAYPLWLLLAGPQRPRGPIRDATEAGADAANLLVPTRLTALQGGTGAWADALRAYPGEQGSYIGPLLLVVLVVAVVVGGRTVRVAAGITGLLAVLSLGTSVVVLDRDTDIPLPWRVLTDVPLIGQTEAGRLAPFVATGVALVVALVLDRALAERRWLVVGAVVLATLTWWPADAQAVTRTAIPPFFSSGAEALAPGETVKTWPRTTGVWENGADPLVWQTAAAMRFRQTGGYFIASDPERPVILEGVVDEYDRGASGEPADPLRTRADLRERGVTAVVVVPRADVDLRIVRPWTTAVTGDPGTETGGVWLYRLR